MPYPIKKILACGWLCAAVLGSAACSPRRIPAMTVADLMEDRVALDGVLMKCNQNPAQSRSNSDCINARIAIERLAAKDADPALEEKRQAEFERAREQRRLAHDKQREEEEAKKKKVDAYSLPLVPVEPAPTPAPPQPSGDPPPLAGTTTP